MVAQSLQQVRDKKWRKSNGQKNKKTKSQSGSIGFCLSPSKKVIEHYASGKTHSYKLFQPEKNQV